MEVRSSNILAKLKRTLVRYKNTSPIMNLLWLESLRFRGWLNLKKYDDRQAIEKLYSDYSGQRPNIDQPTRFSEKLQWLKLHNRDPLQSVLADKHAVRDWLHARGYGDLLIQQLDCVTRVKDINFTALPNQFVIKAAHSSGWNLICKDKTALNWPMTRMVLASWLRQGIFWNGREWPYHDIPYRLVIEEYLEDSSGQLRDYKVHCFNGVPKFIQANSGRYAKVHAQNFYDLDWNILPFGKDLSPRPDVHIAPPQNLKRMIEIARDLAQDHPYVRVDFYDVDGRLFFGELTFYPASGLPDFTPEEHDLIWGEMLTLPSARPTA